MVVYRFYSIASWSAQLPDYGLYGLLLEKCGEEDGKGGVNLWKTGFHTKKQWK